MPSRKTCPKCGKTKHKTGFRGRAICILCYAGKRPRLASDKRGHPRDEPVIASRSNMTAEALRKIVAPSEAEMRAVLECVRLMLETPARPHGSNQPHEGPEHVIDAVASDWKRSIKLGSLAIQLLRERVA